MSRSPATWKDSLRLLLLLVVLPIILLLAGPVLTIAALKGRMRLPGGLMLSPGKHRRKNREIAFVMGIILWAFTWSVVGWMGAAIYFNASPDGGVSVTAIELTPMSLPSPTQTETLTPTATLAPTETPSPADTPFATPTPSPKMVTDTPSPHPTDTPTAIFAAEMPAASPSPTLDSAAEISMQATAIQTVSAANRALRQAIDSPNTQNLDALGDFWQGNALTRVRIFAQEMHDKYRAPVQANYNLEGAYQISEGDVMGEMVVTSQERWQFEGASGAQSAFTIYTYTVHWDGETWKIVDYDFSVAGR